ncbi:MAG TPA: hypothetical protein VLG76_04395 [Rhabdochlamydiaceae bacterium]|nr:hypothetical protein [Rhabdochlamydiaceae bacterium]
MKQKEPLTNEEFKGICKSNFELTLYAINLGKYYIRSGHEADIRKILDEVKRHPNPSHLIDLEKFEEADREEQSEDR